MCAAQVKMSVKLSLSISIAGEGRVVCLKCDAKDKYEFFLL